MLPACKLLCAHNFKVHTQAIAIYISSYTLPSNPHTDDEQCKFIFCAYDVFVYPLCSISHSLYSPFTAIDMPLQYITLPLTIPHLLHPCIYSSMIDIMTTNMEEVPLSPELKSNLKSPSLRIRSPSTKSNIAISSGDDDSSIDDDRINNKMCVSDGSTITCVFNKKRLFGGSALAFVAVVVIMAVSIATTGSDGGSSNSMASIGGNSNSAVGATGVGSAAAPTEVAPKVEPVTPIVKQSNFAFVPNSVGYSGKSGKSGRNSCSSSDFNRSFNPFTDDLWSGSGKSGKSGSNSCSFGSSGKSGKSGGYSSLVCDAWHSSGKSGKSNSVPTVPGVSKVIQSVRSGCFASTPPQGQGYAGVITPGETYCGQLVLETGLTAGQSRIQRYTDVDYGTLPLTQSIDSYLFRVGCAESVYSFLLTSKQNYEFSPVAPGFATLPIAVVRVRRIPDEDIDTSYSGKSGKSGGYSDKSGKSGGGFPQITCPAPGTEAYNPISTADAISVFADIGTGTPDLTKSGTTGYSLQLDEAGLYEVTVLPTAGATLFGAVERDPVGTCAGDTEFGAPFDYTLKVVPGKIEVP